VRRVVRGLMALAVAMLARTVVAGDIDDVIGVERMRFRNIGVAQGLSQPSVLDIVQDAQGFIWAATQDGLDRYDGYGFRVFKHDRADAWSLGSNNPNRLLVDRQGRLWVATSSGGLSRYDQRLDRFDNFRPDAGRPDALGGEYVVTLSEDAAGTLWIGTRDHGLQRYDEAHGNFSDSLCKGRAL
jgi:ligand-binding sensor domain-containing protein